MTPWDLFLYVIAGGFGLIIVSLAGLIVLCVLIGSVQE